ncbi:MAG: tyrosine-type recombinase/integrase [Thermomicrobiales bacterium]
MPTHNPENERLKRAYFAYLKEARRLGEHSIDAAAAALNHFETYTKNRPFKSFHIQQAMAFKRKLAEELNQRTGEPLSKSTILTTLHALRAFFQWLSLQPGYRSRLSYADAEYFNLSAKDTRIAKVVTDKWVPTIPQILNVIRAMPSAGEIDRRNRALIAFTLLTGARDGAIVSLKLKHVHVEEGKLVQDAREVKTKFSKSFTTWFFPVAEEVLQIVVQWIEFLTNEKLFGPDDPLFPATRIVVGPDHRFQRAGLTRSHWTTATPVRAIFKDAFAGAGLPYANPHVFRATLVQLGQQLCRTPEEFKAWSQNLGHESMITTFSSYGRVSQVRQAEILRQMGQADDPIKRTKDVIDEMRLFLQRVGKSA